MRACVHIHAETLNLFFLWALADIGCSSSFWKKMEPNFAPVNLEDIAYMKQLVGALTIFVFVKFKWHLMEPFLCYSLHQVKTVEVDQKCLSQMLCLGSDALVMSKKLKSYICTILQIWHLVTDDYTSYFE